MENDDFFIEVTHQEWREGYERRLKELNITEEELLRQASQGNFDTHQIHMLWFMVGGWKDGKPYINV